MTSITFTPIFPGSHDDHGELMVCVRGTHNLGTLSFNPLEFDFEVLQRRTPDSAWVLLEDRVVGQELVSLANTYWRMMRGTVVTTDAQPWREVTDETEIWRLDIPEYGVTIVESCGLVPYDDDVYHIFVAHPGPGVYLTVILEVIGSNPPAWIGIRLDEERVDAIIDLYLRNIGAIEAEESSAAKEEADAPDADLSVC